MNRKKIIYGVIFLAIISIVWLIFATKIYTSKKTFTENLIISNISTWEKEISIYSEAFLREISHEINQKAPTSGSNEELSTYLTDTFVLSFDETDETGKITYNSINVNLGRLNEEDFSKGFAIKTFKLYTDEYYVAPVFLSTTGNYFYTVLSAEDYLNAVLSSISFNGENPVVFVGDKPVTQIGDMYSQNEFLQNAKKYAFIDTVNYFKVLSKHEYNVYFQLPINNWFVGAKIPSPDLANLFYYLIVETIVIAIVCLGVVIYVIAEDFKFTIKLKDLNNTSKDELTKLTSPSRFEAVLETFLENKDSRHYSLIILDIASFQRFNIFYGFDDGDALLKLVGNYIHNTSDCGTRVNNDIFLFVAKSTPKLTEEIEKSLNTSVILEMGEQYSSFLKYNFGVYPLIDEPFNYRRAYDGAFMALRKSKNNKNLNYTIYDRDMFKKSEKEKNIELNMYRALLKREFQIYIQPQFKTETSELCSAEALVRWRSENMGFMSPNQFIPLFERNGFIAELDFFMLENIMSIQEKLYLENKKPCAIAVNQSRITISLPNYLERIEEIYSKFTFPPSLIEFEITENTLMENLKTISSLIDSLRTIGFKVAMDDFGSGYSSLNTLRELPFDTLKLDRDLVIEAEYSEKGQSIIKNIINMAKDLEINTICEGIENAIQLEFLRKSGCNIVQGYFLSYPLAYEDYYEKYFSDK